jgi:hypothetical protein
VLQSTPIVETALSQISETRDRLCITSTLATPHASVCVHVIGKCDIIRSMLGTCPTFSGQE